jgi:hypothetical protein
MHTLSRRIVSVVVIFSLLFVALVPSVSADHVESCADLNGFDFSASSSSIPAFSQAGTGEQGTTTITSDSNPNQMVTLYEFNFDTSTFMNQGDFALPLTLTSENDEFHVYVISTVGGGVISYTVSFSCGLLAGARCFEGDARINNDDCGALVALYQDGTTIDAYGIDPASGEGVLVFRFDLSTAGDVTENTLIAEGTNPFNGQPIRLYKLVGGGYQVNTTQPNGEPYAFSWS